MNEKGERLISLCRICRVAIIVVYRETLIGGFLFGVDHSNGPKPVFIYEAVVSAAIRRRED